MPYCAQCGNQVTPVDSFCRSCGAQQPISSTSESNTKAGSPDPLARMSPRTAGVSCYLPFVGWVGSVVVLASSRFSKDPVLRFHAFQGLFLFVAWLIVEVVLSPAFRWSFNPGFNPFRVLDKLLHVAIFGAWIWMLIKTSQGVVFKLPIIGDLAERSVSEQRI